MSWDDRARARWCRPLRAPDLWPPPRHFATLLTLLRHALVRRQTDGATPLFSAAKEGHLDVVKELVQAGANKDAATVRLPSPLAPTAADPLARLAAAGEALEARESAVGLAVGGGSGGLSYQPACWSARFLVRELVRVCARHRTAHGARPWYSSPPEGEGVGVVGSERVSGEVRQLGREGKGALVPAAACARSLAADRRRLATQPSCSRVCATRSCGGRRTGRRRFSSRRKMAIWTW